MALQEERSLQESNLQSVEETWNELKAELESQKENLEKRIAECRTRLEALEAQRAEVAALISPPVLSRYEFIRNRLRHPVIVPVEAGICSGCHIAIPPQVFIDLQRGNHIMSCPNCQRLMYWAHDYQDPNAPKPEARAAESANKRRSLAAFGAAERCNAHKFGVGRAVAADRMIRGGKSGLRRAGCWLTARAGDRWKAQQKADRRSSERQG